MSANNVNIMCMKNVLIVVINYLINSKQSYSLSFKDNNSIFPNAHQNFSMLFQSL